MGALVARDLHTRQGQPGHRHGPLQLLSCVGAPPRARAERHLRAKTSAPAIRTALRTAPVRVRSDMWKVANDSRSSWAVLFVEATGSAGVSPRQAAAALRGRRR